MSYKMRGSDGTRTAQMPPMAEILEALEVTGPWSVHTDTRSSEIPWTLAEHERFVEGVRMYSQGSYELIAGHIGTKRSPEVTNYGLTCWRSKAYQKLRTRRTTLVTASTSSARTAIPGVINLNEKVKVVGAADEVKVEPGPFPLPPTEDVPQQQIVAWRRIMLEWCIQTISRHRSRRQEQANTCTTELPEVEVTDTPTSKPEIYATEQTNSLCHVLETRRIHDGTPVSTSSAAPPRFGSRKWLVWHNSRATPWNKLRCMLYGDEEAEEDKEDHYGMRAAKRAALEIEWCDAMTEQGFIPVPSRDTLKKMGVWSSDEHARYCAALKLYRYGSWSQIANHVGSRTERQVSSHAQSIRAKRKRAAERQKHCNTGTASQNLGALKATSANPTMAAVSTPPLSTIDLVSLESKPMPTFTNILRTSMSGPVPGLENSGCSNNLTAPVYHPSDDMNFTTFLSEPKLDVLEPSNDRVEDLVGIHTRNRDAAKADGEEKFHRSHKRSKPTPSEHPAPLYSSPLDDLLEMLLSDEDLFEPLDVGQV